MLRGGRGGAGGGIKVKTGLARFMPGRLSWVVVWLACQGGPMGPPFVNT